MYLTALNKKKKIAMLIVFIALGVMALGGIVTAFLLNYNSLSPEAPSILDDGNNIYITTSANENYDGYRFKFASGGEEILIDCQDNIISVDKMIENDVKVGINYKVSVCYLSDTEGGASQYSKSISWTCEAYLSSPEIERNALENKITWQAVENADYYQVYYNDGHDLKSIRTAAMFFDTSVISGGDKEVFIVAHSEKGYKHSKQSNVLSFHHVYSLKRIEESNARLDATTKILSFRTTDDLNFIKISFDEGKSYNIVKLAEPIIIDGLNVYKVDLSQENNLSQVTFSPYPADENSVYTGSGTTIYSLSIT